jgi:two-component system, chemotaxis family, protein-glutamate methylesterase/glutaminase
MIAFEIIVVGASLGGLQALQALLAGLPAGFPAALAVVQHRGCDPDGLLLAALQAHSVLPVHEPDDKDAITTGRVHLAPADYHLSVERGRFSLSTEGRVCHARPSIDVLFESAADAYGGRAVGVILTGSGRDGARGVAWIKRAGGLVVVQEPATAESRHMPDAALTACDADHVLPLSGIAPFLTGLCPLVPR